jgi:hypothetical protein
MEANFSRRGIGGGFILIWRQCRGISRNWKNSVLYLLDPLCGLTSEWPNPGGVKETTD